MQRMPQTMCSAGPEFEELLAISARTHGHLCPGQVLGVRMSMLGLREAGIAEPKGRDRKHIIVFVEMDRCATDAVQSVTGCTLGHRTMKFMDYGKMAATYVNLRTGKAVRVLARDDSRERARMLFLGNGDKHKAQLEAYKIMSDEDLFTVTEVTVDLKPEDLPGRPLRRVQCGSCGEHVQDMREVAAGDTVLCRACAGQSYYQAGAQAADQSVQGQGGEYVRQS